MMFSSFTTTTHAKWILAGEHAVLRGHGALVFPLKNHQLTLSYTQENAELDADYSGSSGADMSLLFWSVLQQGQQLLGHSLNRLSGHFHIDSNIPIGVGMGIYRHADNLVLLHIALTKLSSSGNKILKPGKKLTIKWVMQWRKQS